MVSALHLLWHQTEHKLEKWIYKWVHEPIGKKVRLIINSAYLITVTSRKVKRKSKNSFLVKVFIIVFHASFQSVLNSLIFHMNVKDLLPFICTTSGTMERFIKNIKIVQLIYSLPIFALWTSSIALAWCSRLRCAP